MKRTIICCFSIFISTVLIYQRLNITSRPTLLLTLVFFCAWLSGCSVENENGVPTPPLKIPFAVQTAGAKIETEVQVVDHKNYIFNLAFMFKEHDENDRVRVKKLVGEDMQYKDGDSGIPTSLHFKITLIDTVGEKIIFDQVLKDLRLRSWSGTSYSKHITDVALKPGHYLISVESLKDAPELMGTPVIFIMGSYAKASNID
jgi:hypothetical protein